MSLVTVILAAGQGTRMKSKLPKVLHPIMGTPMLFYVIEQAQLIKSSRIILVIGYKKDKVINSIHQGEFYQIEFAEQREQLGTGHAVYQTMNLLNDYHGDLLILSGDVPMIKHKTLKKLIQYHQDHHSAATMLTTTVINPSGLGRIIRDSDENLIDIIEEKDIKDDRIREIHEINVGIYVFKSPKLFECLALVDNQNEQGEYYLPDVFKIIKQSNHQINCYHQKNISAETKGINTPEQLQEVERSVFYLCSRSPSN